MEYVGATCIYSIWWWSKSTPLILSDQCFGAMARRSPEGGAHADR